LQAWASSGVLSALFSASLEQAATKLRGELMRSLLKTFARWYSTVRELMKSGGDKVHIEADGDNLKFDVEKGRRIAGGE
jgi:hypothetical protein